MLQLKTVGAPSLYNASEDCERVVELGKLGYSDTEIAAELNISRRTLYNWIDVHVAFKEAMELAATYSQAWWEAKGRGALLYDKFQSAVYNKIMTCRFRHDYGDKLETTIKNPEGETLKIESQTPEEAAKKYNELLETIK